MWHYSTQFIDLLEIIVHNPILNFLGINNQNGISKLHVDEKFVK